MSGGSSFYQWRLVSFVRSYILKQYPLAEDIEKDALKILSSHVNATSRNDNSSNDLKPSNTNTKSEAGPNSAGKGTLSSYIPQVPQIQLPFGSKEKKSDSKEKPLPKWRVKKQETVAKSSIDDRTRHLLRGISSVRENVTMLRRVEDLCAHLRLYPTAKGGATKNSGIPKLLQALNCTADKDVQGHVHEALSLLGYANPVKGHGIRILSIDGGGVRGLVAIEALKCLEAKAGKPIHELFDLVCGVSTGAIIASLISAHQSSLDECEKLYREISGKIFSQTRFKGTANLITNSSFYDSEEWNKVLKINMGDFPLIEMARNPKSPKMCLVAMLLNSGYVEPFLFRTYEMPYRVASHFKGTSSHKVWEAVRSSAAAPTYFSEYKVDDMILLDGGVMVNNPSAIGIHEACRLWPDTPIQTVISLGTGRHVPLETVPDKSISWISRMRTFINSATDTEGVHTTLNDLLPANAYFRFNPYLSEEVELSEIREGKISSMMDDTRLYFRKNDTKVQDATKSLLLPKSYLDQAGDFVHKRKLLARL